MRILGPIIHSFRPLAGLSCINTVYTPLSEREVKGFPSPRGVELHKPVIIPRELIGAAKFPSPRGVELHKPTCVARSSCICHGFRPLAGLSCINLKKLNAIVQDVLSFRPLAGLSCINN